MNKSDQNFPVKRYFFGILLIAFIVRVWGIWHGYPYSFYPDEAHFVKRSLSFGSGDFNPHWFHKPAFLMYILFFEYGLFFIIGKMIGLWQTVTDFAVFYIINPGPFYLIGRMTIAMFSTATVAMSYLIGVKIEGKKTGLIGALILALSMGHVYVTKDIKADIPCTFFTILSAYFLICFFKDSLNKYLWLAVAFAGIGTATKTYTIVMLFPICLAVFSTDGILNLGNFLQKIKYVFFCFGLFMVFYFIFSPYNFIDPLGRDFTFRPIISLSKKVELLVTGKKLDQSVLEKNMAQNIKNPEISLSVYISSIKSYLSVVKKGIGVVAMVLCTVGFIYIPMLKEKVYILGLLAFPLLFAAIAVFASPGYSEIRHQVVIYPFLAVIAAVVVTKGAVKLPVVLQPIAICIVLCSLLSPLYGIYLYNKEISQPETRNIAKKWIETNIPDGTKIVMDESGPRLYQSERQLEPKLKQAAQADPKGQFTAHYDKYIEYQIKAVQNNELVKYQIDEIRIPWWKQKEEKPGVHLLDSEFDKDMGNPLRPVGVYSYDYYIQNGYGYAIVHSKMYGSFVRSESDLSKRFPSFNKFYTCLFEKGLLIKEFKPEKGKSRGPIVRIYQLR
ncbi:MAG: glycosyltransferase family 39 protein [Desulfobacter sp.]|nr:MAG: glycosyltransferase family 39 protein [Desulfobacter sp.]